MVHLKMQTLLAIPEGLLCLAAITPQVSRGSLLPFQSVQSIKPCAQLLWLSKYLRHSIGRRIHEFRKVHGAFPLILGYVDGLDWGEAWVGIAEVLQPQPPLHQAHVGPLHEHLWGAASHVSATVKDVGGSQSCVGHWEGWCQNTPTHGRLVYLVLQEHDELGTQDQALEPGWLQERSQRP